MDYFTHPLPTLTASTSLSWADPARQTAFDAWLAPLTTAHRLNAASLRPASADASFRRYFRIDAADGTRIVMDAPPAQEDSQPFVRLAGVLRAAGLNVPEVQAWDESQGFMLLSDLGPQTYLDALQSLDLSVGADQRRANTLYLDAFHALVRLQQIDAATAAVPAYDAAFVQRELDLFTEWYVTRHRGVTLTDKQQTGLNRAFELIQQVWAGQAQVLVHRDFHSRNLMVGAADVPNAAPGVLDFQGALWGPVAYDAASLLRDAYVDWDEEQQLDWAVRYWQAARKAGVPVPDDFGTFWRDIEWTGLQRHLKVLGIFSRLHHRDGKSAYLADLPRVWRHAHHVAMRYSVLTPLARLLEQLADVQAQEGYTF